jgi:GT2 family glycosyltransferase
MLKTDIVVVSYLSHELLDLCIKSILDNSSHPFTLYIVDNASNEETKDVIKRYSTSNSNIVPIMLDTNIGYGAAANIGIGAGSNDTVAILNNDIILPKGWENLSTYLLEHPNVGVIGPKLVNYKNQIVGAGVIESKDYHTVQGWLIPNADNVLSEIQDVIYVGGSALFMSRKFLEDIKENGQYFDEQFDFYFEDFDIALRAKKKNYKVQYCPICTLIHKHEGSLMYCSPNGIGGRHWRNKKHWDNLEKFKKKYPEMEI